MLLRGFIVVRLYPDACLKCILRVVIRNVVLLVLNLFKLGHLISDLVYDVGCVFIDLVAVTVFYFFDGGVGLQILRDEVV